MRKPASFLIIAFLLSGSAFCFQDEGERDCVLRNIRLSKEMIADVTEVMGKFADNAIEVDRALDKINEGEEEFKRAIEPVHPDASPLYDLTKECVSRAKESLRGCLGKKLETQAKEYEAIRVNAFALEAKLEIERIEDLLK